MKVKQIMSKTVYSCDIGTTLESVAKMMWNHDCGCIPVVNERNVPTGIITDRDIAIGSALQHKPLSLMTVGDIINGHQLFTCKSSDEISSALLLMQQHSVRRLPVVDGNGKLAGIISLGDILAGAETKDTANLPLKQTLGMLKAVTGHHAELQVA